MGNDLEDFFSSLDPKYSKYAATLRAAGVKTLSEVPEFSGLLVLKIPLLDANHISSQLAAHNAARTARLELELEAGGIAQSWQLC
jgi:hypothetical protein